MLALLGLLVPVAIHLWNRRPGREVAVGSLRWLAAGANRRLRNLKPEQLWLLLLRAVLLAVLAVAVAEPVWRQAQPASRGQILLGPEVLDTPAFTALRPTIDSLRRRGYVVRWLATGFARVPGAAWRTDSAGRHQGRATLNMGTSDGAAGFQWARVQQAVGLFVGQPLLVVTGATLRDFQGAHPPLPATVTWQTLPIDTPKTWLQAAALRADSLRLLLARSTETQTIFRVVAVARPQPGAVLRVAGLAPLRFETGTTGGKPKLVDLSVDSTQTAIPTVPVRTRPLRVVIYSTPDFTPDARCLRAGLQAAATGLPVPLELHLVNTPPRPDTPPDWLFWLSDAPIPATWRGAVRQGTHVWQEATGPGTADTAQLATTVAQAAAVSVFRRGKPAGSTIPSAALWADDRGRPLLTRQAQGRGANYHLHTRLNPAWSELADDPALPARLLALLQPELTDDMPPTPTALDQQLAAHDQRALDPAQVFSRQRTAEGPGGTVRSAGPPPTFCTIDLRPWLVLVAGLLFLFERLLARRREARALPSAS